MIKVNYKCDDDFVKYLLVKGHSRVKDDEELSFVCAVVSTILTGGLNAIDDENNYKFTLKSGFCEVIVDQVNEKDNAVLNTLIAQLLTLSKKYYREINVSKN